MHQSSTVLYKSLARALGGALLFAFPVLMTMETWWLGFYLPRERIGLFLVVSLPIVFGLSHVSGFRPTSSLFENAVDTFVAYAVGVFAATLFLTVFGVIEWWTESLDSALGQIALLTVPCTFGAVFASKQLGVSEESNERKEVQALTKYFPELGIMVAGALYGALTVSPTEEMFLIAYKMTPELVLALMLLSLVLMHGFVYGMSFRGEQRPGAPSSFLDLFYRYTVVGYAISIGMATYILWTFHRLDGLSAGTALMVILVTAFPAAIGAAASRLVL